MVYPLSLEFCHPGTSLLALAREEVGIEYSQIASVFIKYLVCLDVWVVYRYLFVLLKGDAIQFVGESEYTVYHFVQLEIRAKHFCIEIIFLHLEFMRIEAEIPWFHFEIFTLQFLGKGFHFFHFLFCRWLISLYQVVEKFIYMFCIACHTVAKNIVGIGFETEQLGEFSAQVYQSFADFQVVLLVIMGTYRIACHIHLFAELTLGRVGHKWRIAWIIECKDPAFFFLLFGGMRSGSFCCFRKSVELSFVCDMECKCLVFF